MGFLSRRLGDFACPVSTPPSQNVYHVIPSWCLTAVACNNDKGHLNGIFIRDTWYAPEAAPDRFLEEITPSQVANGALHGVIEGLVRG